MTELRIEEGVSKIPAAQWNALVGDASPFLEWEWLASLEDAGCVGERTGWIPQPVVAFDGDELVAACPLYVKLHSEGEFVHDWSWADASERAGIPYYPKLVAGIPFSPVTGARFLVAEGLDRREWQDRIARFLRDVCEPNGLSGVHVNFCLESELECLADAGYQTRIGIQYHWQNQGYESFEEYLGRFRSKRRNQIRRERRELRREGIRLECVSEDAIDEEIIAHVYRFYLSTIDAHAWGRQYLNREFFELMAERFRSRLLFSLARRGDEVIGGTFNVVKGDALYGRYWGCDQPLRNLHFDACYYAPVEWCIENGIQRFEPGAGGDYKQLRGFDAQPTYSGHHLRDPRLARAIGDFLTRERAHADETIDWIQDRSALKKTKEI